MTLTVLRVVTCAVVLGGAVYAARIYPTLPETIATHFRGDGLADGFSSRASFYLVCAVIAVLFLAMVFGTLLLRYVPARFFNLPRRNYWLAPERREETVRAIETYLALFVLGATVFVMVVLVLVVDANRRDPPQLDNRLFLTVLVGYCACVLVWVVVFVARFLRKPARTPRHD